MPTALSPNEEAQLMQTIEMFEVITQSQPADHQSLEILKEAYLKLGRQKDVVNTAKRIAQAYVLMGQLSSAILEYESVLQLFPDDPDVQKALAEIENRATSFSAPAAPADLEPVESLKLEPSGPPPPRMPGKPAPPVDIDDGRAMMKKLFVDGKIVSEADFNPIWHTPDPSSVPAKAVEPFLQALADRGLCAWEKAVKLISEKTKLAYLSIDKYDIDIEVARSFPKEICRRWCVLPFDKMSKSIFIATANPYNKQATRELEQAKQCRLHWFLANPSELVKIINKIYR